MSVFFIFVCMMLFFNIKRCYINYYNVDYDILEIFDGGVDDLYIIMYLLMDVEGNLYVGGK